MKIYKGLASLTIHAPVERIWAILVDISAWHAWDANFIKVEGSVALGAEVRIFSTLFPDRAVSVEVTELTPTIRMTWTSTLAAGGCTGVHTYILIPKSAGDVEFVTYEYFSGPLVATIETSIPDMTDSFNQFAAGLKRRAEAHEG